MIRLGNKRNFEDFKPQIPNQGLPLFNSIRKFCLELGDNVIEDVRMHRIIYCKSMTFRWFLDVEPEDEGLILKIQKDRKDMKKIIHIKKDEEITEYTKFIKEAFDLIH